MSSTKKLARIAGLLYVLLSIAGVYGLLYVPSAIIVHGDAAATAHRILASETLFRSGIVADLIGQAIFILVALVLYRLLKGVDRTMAALMVIWLVVQIPIVFLAEVHHLSVLTILHGTGPAAAFSEAQRNAQMMVSLPESPISPRASPGCSCQPTGTRSAGSRRRCGRWSWRRRCGS